MGDLMGCQVSNVGKDNSTYDREGVEVSLELQPLEIAVPWARVSSALLAAPGAV